MTSEPKSRFVSKVLLRQSIASVRLVIALFTVTAAITKILYDRFLPDLIDLDAVRWTIIAFGTVAFMISFVRLKRSAIISYFGFTLYVATLLYCIWFVVANRFDPNTVTILILVLGASSVIINSLFYYGIQGAITILACAISYSMLDEGSGNLIAFLNLPIAIGVFGIVMSVRLQLISSVKNSYSNLERLNVLSIVANRSGEIVFVSPSAKTLLGYDPRELVKDGWYKSKDLRDGWISKDYILNYPNIMPKEIMTMETSVVSKDGKKVWFNWVNSMLPNGSYVGVALDITKYKNG
jgi:PAS domain S-box-containing protein